MIISLTVAFLMMIKGFKDKETEKVFNGRFSKKLPHDIQRVVDRKLIILHRSVTLNGEKTAIRKSKLVIIIEVQASSLVIIKDHPRTAIRC